MYKLITVALGAALFSVSATAQTTDQAKAVRIQFDDCVYRSANQQFKEARDRGIDPRAVDVDAITERGFDACKTELKAMASFLRSIDVPRDQASNFILHVRLQIKETMRDMVAHPERYVAGVPPRAPSVALPSPAPQLAAPPAARPSVDRCMALLNLASNGYLEPPKQAAVYEMARNEGCMGRPSQ